ncbi:MAG: hypothetical protein ACRDDX_05815 [Cellulosilyticaceae bacterium]
MATWVSYFRVAEYFRTKLDIEEVPFIVANIGPDCGEPNEDWSQFTPPGQVTHWQTGTSRKNINSEAFFETYLKDRETLSKRHYSFYMGYYLHLLTDIAFIENMWNEMKVKYKEELEADKDFVWKMKEDWYDLDRLYLKKNPNFHTFKVFEEVESFPNDYLDYYSDTAMIRQIKYITSFYQESERDLEREYIYLTELEMSTAVDKACEDIMQDLRAKGIL